MAVYTQINDPSAFFKVQLYTGNGSANHSITFDDTDTDMQPDMVWIKNRDATDHHCVFDSVRGVTKVVFWSGNSAFGKAEQTDTDTLDAFESDGFRVDDDDKVNTNAEKYVAWCWKAGTTSGINTTGADITLDSYSFNQTAGFSIILYEGNKTDDQQIPHGLGAVPHMIILDVLSGENVTVQHQGQGGAIPGAPYTDYLHLNSGSKAYDDATPWSDEAPTSVLFTVGANDGTNSSGNDIVVFSWSAKQGYSKFGLYEGNANANGTFVYLGFRPALVICKGIDATSTGWLMFDNKRLGYNADNNFLHPSAQSGETAVVEDTTNCIDLLSNGFKCRISSDPNVGSTYVYCAWAESPFVNSSGVPTNAR